MRICAALCLLALFAVCCSEQTVNNPLPDRPLLVLMNPDVATMDPHLSFEITTSTVLGNVYEPLVVFDSSFHLTAGLAKRWITPNDRTWRFYLRETARFSDGSPLTANDVKFSIERVKDLSDSELQGFTEHITSIIAVDDHTVDIHTSEPVSILNNLVFLPVMSEKHARAAGDKIAETALGTGPYKILEWIKNKKIVLRANEYYQPQPPIKEVHFLISESIEKVLDDTLRLKPDLTLSLPFRRIEEFQNRKTAELKLTSSSGISVYYLVFNMKPSIPDFAGKNPLADLRLRTALAHATDVNELIREVMYGYARPASQLIAPEIFGYNPSVSLPAFDPEAGKKVIREAGYVGLKIPIYTSQDGTHRMEKMLIEQWKKIGVDPVLKILPSDEELNTALYTGEFAVSISGYTCTSGDASELLTFMLHTRDGEYGKGNYAFYDNPRVNQLCETNLSIFDPKERLQMLQETLGIASKEIPYLPLFIVPDVYIVSERIQWTPPVNGEIKLNDISFVKQGTQSAKILGGSPLATNKNLVR